MLTVAAPSGTAGAPAAITDGGGRVDRGVRVTANMVANLVAKAATWCRAEPDDLYSATRSAGARIWPVWVCEVLLPGSLSTPRGGRHGSAGFLCAADRALAASPLASASNRTCAGG